MSRARRIASATIGAAFSLSVVHLAGQSAGTSVADTVEIGHGSDLRDDLSGGPDRYRFSQSPYSSYEVVLEAVSGDPGFEIARTDAAGTTVLQSSVGTSAIGITRSLRWINASSSSIDSHRLRVTDGGCGSGGAGCSGNQVYRLRAYETTYAVPRYSHTGSQVSIVMLQNPAGYSIAGLIYFWSTGGALLNAGGYAFTLAPRGSLALNTSSIPSLAGTAGSVTIAHTGRYGDLSGKVVTLEPATGSSFDTAMSPRVK